MKLTVGGTERIFPATVDGVEGVILCLNSGRDFDEAAVHDTLCDALGAQAELERTRPTRWVILGHRGGEAFECTCQRAIDTITALGVDLKLLRLDHDELEFGRRS